MIDDDLFDDRDARTFQAALDAWGTAAQLDMAEEEAGEFLVASKHYRRGKVTREALIDEMADVRIMCEQLKLLFGTDPVELRVQEKMGRLRERLPDDADLEDYDA